VTLLANTYVRGADTGGVALLLGVNTNLNESSAKQALAHAIWISPDLNNGRVDLYQAVGATAP
jgi:hypothetical protein